MPEGSCITNKYMHKIEIKISYSIYNPTVMHFATTELLDFLISLLSYKILTQMFASTQLIINLFN